MNIWDLNSPPPLLAALLIKFYPQLAKCSYSVSQIESQPMGRTDLSVSLTIIFNPNTYTYQRRENGVINSMNLNFHCIKSSHFFQILLNLFEKTFVCVGQFIQDQFMLFLGYELPCQYRLYANRLYGVSKITNIIKIIVDWRNEIGGLHI